MNLSENLSVLGLLNARQRGPYTSSAYNDKEESTFSEDKTKNCKIFQFKALETAHTSATQR